MTTLAKIQLAPNVPVRMQVKYVDVWPNDPTKDPKGVGYGASVRLKGTADGADAVCYPKGKAWAVLKALVEGGVIAPGDYPDDPAEKYSIPVVVSDVVLTLAQAAGQRYADFTAVPAGGSPNGNGAAKPAPSTGTGTGNGAGKQPVSIGGPLPWEEGEHPAGANAAPAPAVRAQTSDVAPGAAANPWAAMKARYHECVDAAVIEAAALLKLGVAVDGQAVAAMAATLFIQRNQRGC